jgi:hypothetical protein
LNSHTTGSTIRLSGILESQGNTSTIVTAPT